MVHSLGENNGCFCLDISGKTESPGRQERQANPSRLERSKVGGDVLKKGIEELFREGSQRSSGRRKKLGKLHYFVICHEVWYTRI